MNAPVLIMAGGTGGHIFPGLAVAAELRARDIPVVWLGGTNGLESRLVPQAGFPLETLAITGVRGKGLKTLLLAPLQLLRAVIAARGVLKRIHPRSVLSMGGYAAAPGGIAAWLMRIPLIVHEQNRIPGVTNRLLAHFACKVLSGFADSFPAGRAQWIGNPVRADIAATPAPAERFAGRSGRLRLLVLGGSQGAQILNLTLPQTLKRIPTEQRPEILHQCGAKHLDKTIQVYIAANVEARVEAFIDNMAQAYAWADLVVCRSGALTLAELAAAGLPSILIPFAQAVDDHQTKNAQTLVAAGAARLVMETEATAEFIAALLIEFGTDRACLIKMAEAARTQAKQDAARHIADYCLEVAA